MRHIASMVASMEGVGRPVYRIAWELSQNSRSGLTTRFLAKKLEVPEEEVEYLVDVNHHLLFTDLTKIKLASEGHSAVKRISEGLENLGDVPAKCSTLCGSPKTESCLRTRSEGHTAAPSTMWNRPYGNSSEGSRFSRCSDSTRKTGSYAWQGSFPKSANFGIKRRN